ncbi:MAG TPA: cation:proton antiporter [Actinomycetota bacterium]|nr:cation:proton antiporter [Actinomycetota bacterium]
MHGGPGFILELGGVVLLLAVLARLAAQFGFSPIPLYLLAGLAFGSGGVVPLVTAEGFIAAGAEIGLILLLFSLGLEYTAEELVGGLRSTARVGIVDAASNFLPGFLGGLILGWEVVPSVFLGGVTYISSSGVIARTLDELGWMGNREAPLVLAILVLEDLVMAVFLPLATVVLVGGGAATVGLSVAIAVTVVIGVLWIASRYGDAISRAIFSRSDEALLFGILGLVLVTAGAAEALNVSAAVGAFLAGIAISGPSADRARSLLVPLRAVFAGVFFLFFGFQIDPGTIPSAIVPALALAAIGAATKYGTGWYGARSAGMGPRARVRAGVALIARGEFSIVIAGIAVAAGAEPELGPVAATYVLLLAIAGPVAARIVDRRIERAKRASSLDRSTAG